MANQTGHILSQHPFTASAPCRIDLGGTLDISSFYYPLHYLNPATFNIAIDMRTIVRISSHDAGRVKISSRGFESAEFPLEALPYAHPMGLMFAIAAHFHIGGIHISIESSSPPQSALGGSSSAAVALIGAYNALLQRAGMKDVAVDRIPLLAHGIEQSVAGVPCGIQDQLAAAFGGVNAWYWKGRGDRLLFEKKPLLDPADSDWLTKRMLVSYAGNPHESKDVNGTWVRGFINGTHRSQWIAIAEATTGFIDAFARKDVTAAVEFMNRETDIRREMTPHVLDAMGEKLVEAAITGSCGARFTGAGGGGCIWAFGEPEDIFSLKRVWEKTLSAHPDAAILDVGVDMKGLIFEDG